MSRRLLLVLASLPLLAQKPESDTLLRAMRDELDRSLKLRIVENDLPYYIEYLLDDLNSFHASASLGALIQSGPSRSRVPQVQVRVGDYPFDNTNYVFSDLFGGRAGGAMPLDDSYDLLRHYFWLATDRVFKGSVEALARKRAALRNVTQQEKLNDFARAEPVKIYLPSPPVVHGQDAWTRMARDASAVFAAHPKINSSQVDVSIGYTNSYFINTEGSELRYPDNLFYVRIRAAAQAPDGMPVRDATVFMARTLERLPHQGELKNAAESVAHTLESLVGAPAAEDYSGPVLFDGVAAPQLFAQVVGANLGLTRRPVSEPGRSFPFPQSELEGRQGSRILPEWMDVVDDPTQSSWQNRELQGSYAVDMEAVVPKPLTVIEGGTLKSFLLTRLPVRGMEGSNGRARLPGPFGAKLAVFSNLFVRARESSTAEELKRKLLELASKRGKPHALIIRKLDFPSTSSFDELRRLSTAAGQRGATRPSSLPLLAYRVYPDGREELVRGLRFRSLNVRALRDIVGASDVEHAFDFIGDGSSFPVMGTGGYISTHTVVAPSVLFEDLELEKREEDWPKLPVVGPPPLAGN